MANRTRFLTVQRRELQNGKQKHLNKTFDIRTELKINVNSQALI